MILKWLYYQNQMKEERKLRFNIYYRTDRLKPLKMNVSKEDTIKFLKTLSVAEKSHIMLEEVKEREEEER